LHAAKHAIASLDEMRRTGGAIHSSHPRSGNLFDRSDMRNLEFVK